MATVHLGRLLGAAGFSRTVAIKRLHDAYAKDPEFVAMLLDEARLAASIRHPNVVATLDVVAEEDELLVVMEYVEGDSLAHLTKLTKSAQTRMPIAFAAAIVAQALHGLHAAHEARDKNGEPLGIVHRDVSPQNILVGIDGVSRVLDFGIAKAASRATATEEGQIKGKTAYMAPEQLQHGPVDRRTDIFAASVVLWELVTGERLFFADSPMEIMARVLTMPIESPQKYQPALPNALAAITMRGLDRDPSRRFDTAEEMALAIEEIIGMPRAKDIGAWVAMTARITLDARAQLVHVVEQSSHKMPAAPMTSDSGLARAIEEAERRRENAEMPTDVGGRAVGSGEHASLGSPGSGRPLLAAGIAGLPPQVSTLPMGYPSPRSIPSAPLTGPQLPHAGHVAHAGHVPGEESTELATVQSTIHPRITRPPRASRAGLFIGIAGAVALVASGVVVAITQVRARSAAGDAPPLVAPSDPGSASMPPPMPPGADARVPPVAVPPPVIDAGVAVKRGGGKGTIGPRQVPPPPPQAPGKDPCETTPFIIDAQGQRHFNPACVN